MAYEPTVWKNREVERPRTFAIQDNPDGTMTLIPAEGNVIEPGTPIIAETMNNIEQGVFDAHDLAQQAFQSASEGKQAIATAVTGKGVPASSSDTFPVLAGKIDQIETDKTGDATAIVADVLSGKTAYARGQKLTGTMPNRGVVNQSITTQNGQSIIPAGYHNGAGKVTAAFANLIAGNVKQGVNVGGVVGTAATIMPGGFNVYEMPDSLYNGGSPINVLAFALTISIGGLYRIGFNLYNQLNIAPDRIMVGQIYKNGVPYGSVRKTANGNSNPMRFTEDLLFNNGDSMQIYISTEGPGAKGHNLSNITLSINLGFNRTT